MRSAYVWLIYTVALGVLLQAVLAGQFIAGLAPGLVETHGMVANFIWVLAVGQAGLGIALARRGSIPGWHGWSSVGVAVAMVAQIGLGYVPAAAASAAHVPLGVALFGAAGGLAATVERRQA